MALHLKFKRTISSCLLIAVLGLVSMSCVPGFKVSPLIDSATSASQIQKLCENPAGDSTFVSGRRLTRLEYINLLSDVFGEGRIKGVYASAIAKLPVEGADRHIGFDTSIPDIETILATASEIVGRIQGHGDTRRVFFPGDCLDTKSDRCLGFFYGLVQKIYRRPLSDSEQLSYKEYVQSYAVNGFFRGLERALVSPQAMFMMEEGTDLVQAKRRRLTPYEVASRISFTASAQPPDAALLTAATNGELQTIEQVKPHIERLLQAPAARGHFREIVSSWLNLSRISDPTPTVARSVGVTPSGLSTELTNELLDFAENIVFEQKGTFRDLMLDKTVVAKTARLAKLYGIGMANPTPVRITDERGGIVNRLAIMVSSKDYSDPISRGVYVKRRILCHSLPTPAASVVESRSSVEEEMDPRLYTRREIVSEITKPTSCMSCHSSINAFGFALETFGPLGEVRLKEKVYNSAAQLVAEHAVDSRVSALSIDGRTRSVNGPEDLASILSESGEARTCFSSYLFANTRFREPKTSDKCLIQKVGDALGQNESIFEAMVKMIANDDLFWKSVEAQ